ncbi:hypothetical protein K502DRAFT_349055 [Neoconidiobolus thromboides FSU 785]|nr:hypothetical protein K502DRAFT_349055 [Neoconidiobolus thromboides FSU 785]
MNFFYESVFGRNANGDGTNTYSFVCTYNAEINGTIVQRFWRHEGAQIKNNDRTFSSIISDDALFSRGDGKSIESKFGLSFQDEGIAGLRY